MIGDTLGTEPNQQTCEDAPATMSNQQRPGLFARLFGSKKPGPSRTADPMVPNANVTLSDEERAHLLASIDRPVDKVSIAVSSKKGGVGKTTAILGLGTALARYRRDMPAAIDANPDRGILAERLGEEHAFTVGDLLSRSRQIESLADVRPFMNISESRLAVIASAKDAHVQRAFDTDGYLEAREIIQTFFQIMLTDTGTDLTLPLVDAIYESTDVLIVPATAAADGFRLAQETIEWWRTHSPYGEEIVSRCVVPLAMLETQESDWAGLNEGRVSMDEFTAARAEWVRQQNQIQQRLTDDLYARGVAAVVPVPYDAGLRRGHFFSWDALAPATQDAYIRIAAEVVKLFPEPKIDPSQHQPQRLFDPVDTVSPGTDHAPHAAPSHMAAPAPEMTGNPVPGFPDETPVNGQPVHPPQHQPYPDAAPPQQPPYPQQGGPAATVRATGAGDPPPYEQVQPANPVSDDERWAPHNNDWGDQRGTTGWGS